MRFSEITETRTIIHVQLALNKLKTILAVILLMTKSKISSKTLFKTTPLCIREERKQFENVL